MIKFNINHTVKVKLTEMGLAELKEQHDEMLMGLPRLGEFEAPAQDSDGWSTWQLHSLMLAFGQSMIMGRNLPFETEILIISNS